jgi:hypothetical protein
VYTSGASSAREPAKLRRCHAGPEAHGHRVVQPRKRRPGYPAGTGRGPASLPRACTRRPYKKARSAPNDGLMGCQGRHAGPLASPSSIAAPVNLVIGDCRPRKWSKSSPQRSDSAPGTGQPIVVVAASSSLQSFVRPATEDYAVMLFRRARTRPTEDDSRPAAVTGDESPCLLALACSFLLGHQTRYVEPSPSVAPRDASRPARRS